MFASCIADLPDRVAKIVLACNPRLCSIFRRSFHDIQVIGRDKDDGTEWLNQLPAIDAQISIASLPKYLRPDIESFPRHSGYLTVSKELVNK